MDNPARDTIIESMEHDSDLLIIGGGLNGPASRSPPPAPGSPAR